MSTFKTLLLAASCFCVITAFHTPYNDYSTTDIPSNDGEIMSGTLSTGQRFKTLINKAKYLLENPFALPVPVSSSSSVLSSSSSASTVSRSSSTSSFVSIASVSTFSSFGVRDILFATRTLESTSSRTCSDLATSSSTTATDGPVCGLHGNCIDFTSPVTGMTSPRCRCDDGWVGYACHISTQNVKNHCYNDIFEPLLGETDIDCGGNDCSPCYEGLRCIASSDCLSFSSNPSSSSSTNGLVKSDNPSSSFNRTVICAADTRICTANFTKPSSLYFYTTLRLGGLSVLSIQNDIVTKAIQNTLLRIFLNDPDGTYITNHPEIYSALTIQRIRTYTITNPQQRRLRSFIHYMNTCVTSSVHWRVLTQETGVEIDIEYQVNNTSPSSTSSTTPVQDTLSTAISNGQLLQSITNQVPTLPVTRITYEPSSTNVLQISDRPAPNPIENENTSNDSRGNTFSSIGGTIAIICTVFVLLPLAGLSMMAFLGERDANGHTWVDRSLIVYCPCCARSLVKNPVTASAPRTIFGTKRKPRSVIVPNPALELAGQKQIQIQEERKGGARSGKEFLAEKKAEREALAAVRRPRSASKSRSSTPASSSSTNNNYTSPNGVKRIGGSQPHGVLIDTVKPTVANVVEIMKDTATLGIEIGNAYENGLKLPSPQYTAPNNSSNNAARNSVTRTPSNGSSHNSNTNTSSTGPITTRLAFSPDDDNSNDITMMGNNGGIGRQTAAKMHRPSIVSSSQRVAFSPDVSRREHEEETTKPVPSTPLGPHNGGRSGTIIVVPPSPVASTPLLNHNMQSTPVRATNNSMLNSATPLPPPLPTAIPFGGPGIRGSTLASAYSNGLHSSNSSLNSSINGDSTPASLNDSGYIPPPDLRGNQYHPPNRGY